MNMFICFVIAIFLLYLERLFITGFDKDTSLSFCITVVLLGAHTYFVTRKKTIYGIIIPLIIVFSFYPVYQLVNPIDVEIAVLIGAYVIVLHGFEGQVP